MSNEYIRREDAVNAVPKERVVEYMDEFGAGYNSCRNDMLRSIDSLESADVIPVVHAHWIRHDDADVVEGYYVPEYECSKCRAWKKDDSDFCPDCGAKMDAQGEE